MNEASTLPMKEWFEKVGIDVDANGKAVVTPKPTKEQRRMRMWWIGR
ncbi:MAG: hypothetical protein IPO17_00015 [Flavobacteriales bacterium]|nr:hypothetical protein [Flavobacteriales bacterium]